MFGEAQSFLHRRCLNTVSKGLPSRSVSRTRTNNTWETSQSTAAQRHASSSSKAPEQSLADLLKKKPKSHYEFFPKSIPNGPPPAGSFVVDLSTLKSEFLQLQALAHPDRLPPESRSAAQGLSAIINEAYKTLQSPLKRAEYLLEVRGARAQADEEHVLGQAEGDEEILMEVMEAREAAEEAESEEEICNLRAENQRKIDDVVMRLEEAFKKDDLILAKREAVRLSYWIGVEDRLREGNGNH